jgi:hypothetical protein
MLPRFACLLGVLLSSVLVGANESDIASDGSRQEDVGKRTWHRELNGHFFIPALTIADPFVATLFSVQSGAGLAWVDGPSFDKRGNAAGGDSYTAAALFEAASFQANVFRWWAVRVGGIGGLVGGSDPRSALVLGATVPLDVVAGTTLSWQLGKYLRLAGVLDFDYQHARVINPLAAVQASLVAGQVDLTQIRQKVNTYTLVPGATIAFAPHPALGFVGTIQYLWLRRDDPATTIPIAIRMDVHNIVFGVVAQLDLKPLLVKVPVGIVAAYRARVPINSDEEVAHDLEGGLYYTGRDALVLGIVEQGRWFELRPGFPAKALISSIVVRYYWN